MNIFPIVIYSIKGSTIYGRNIDYGCLEFEINVDPISFFESKFSNSWYLFIPLKGFSARIVCKKGKVMLMSCSHHHHLRVGWVLGLMFWSRVGLLRWVGCVLGLMFWFRVGLLRWCCWSQLFHMLFWSCHKGFFFILL